MKKIVEPYVVAIPTYHRSDKIATKSLKTLQEGHVLAKQVYLFVANEEEKAAYEASVPKHLYHEIVVGVKGIAKQRTFIRQFFPVGQKVVSIDDDVEALLKKVGPQKLASVRDVDGFFRKAFDTLQREGLNLWGIYPVQNAFFMNGPKVSTGLKFVIGALHGYIVRHDKDLVPSVMSEGKEDYEQSILYFKKDGGIVRFNDITVRTKFLDKGGLGPDRFEMNRLAAAYLVKTYPEIVSVFKRKNGMTEVRLSRMDSTYKNRLGSTKHLKTRKNKI